MANVPVQTVKGDEVHPPSLIEKVDGLAARIRDRAYQIFRHHGKDGRSFDDWLQAERDLIVAPVSELIEKDGQYEIRVAAPGFEVAETNVTALPDAVIVSAESTHSHDENTGNVHFCEFGEKTLYRRIDLPGPIDLDKVTATLDNGILKIAAQRAGVEAKARSAAAS